MCVTSMDSFLRNSTKASPNWSSPNFPTKETGTPKRRTPTAMLNVEPPIRFSKVLLTPNPDPISAEIKSKRASPPTKTGERFLIERKPRLSQFLFCLHRLAASPQFIEHHCQDDDGPLDDQLPIEGDVHQCESIIEDSNN